MGIESMETRPMPHIRSGVRLVIGHILKPGTLLLIGILAAAFAVRFWMLGQVPAALWYDEITGYYIPFLVLHGISSPSTWTLIQSSPPSTPTLVYYVSYSTVQGNIWSGLFQTSDPTLMRFAAVVYGVGSIFLLFKLGSELFDRRVGFVAAGLGILTPWMFYFSRYIVPPSSLEFWPLAAVYLGLTGMRSKSRLRLSLSIVCGGFVAYTHLSGVVVLVLLLLPLWAIWAARLASPQGVRAALLRPLWFIPKVVPYVGGLVLVLFPILWFQLQPGFGVFGGVYYVWQQYGWTSRAAQAFFTNVGWSWSPDFLAITGGLQGAQTAGFLPHISIGGAWQYGAGYTGMLTELGWLLYLGLPLIVFQGIRNPRLRDAAYIFVALAITYTVVGGAVWFDNPNAGRLAFAAGFFVIVIAYAIVWLIDQLWKAVAHARPIPNRVVSRPLPRLQPPSRAPTVVLAICAIVVIGGASIPYGAAYFDEFPATSAIYFDANISQVARLLSAGGLWNHEIVVEAPTELLYILPGELAFYDPHQPPPFPILAFNGSPTQLVPLISTTQGFIFVSMTSVTLDSLAGLGIPATLLATQPPVTVYRVFGSESPFEHLSFVKGWIDQPQQSFVPAQLNASISHVAPGENLSLGFDGGEMLINSSLSANSTSNQFWQIDVSLPVSLSMVDYSLVNLSWVSNAKGAAGGPYMIPIIQNQTGLFTEQAQMVYPASLLNILPPLANLSSYFLTGFALLGSLAPGSEQHVEIQRVSVYSVTGVLDPLCSTTQSEIRGSQFDVAFSTSDGLFYNSFKSTLGVNLCPSPSFPTNISSIFVYISYRIVTPFPAPFTALFSIDSFSGNLTGPGGPPDSNVSLFASLPVAEIQSGSRLQINLSFVGQMILTGVGICGFYTT